jgi:hypothetical protein
MGALLSTPLGDDNLALGDERGDLLVLPSA